MKTQKYGVALYCAGPYGLMPSVGWHGWFAWGEVYREKRENGVSRDAPPIAFPDWRDIPLSAYSWVAADETTHLANVEWYDSDRDSFRIPDAARYRNKDGDWEVTLRVNETPEMRRWMEQRDVNYLTRLAREGRLYDAEPHWESEVSKTVLHLATKDPDVVKAMAAHGSQHPAARVHREALMAEQRAAKVRAREAELAAERQREAEALAREAELAAERDRIAREAAERERVREQALIAERQRAADALARERALAAERDRIARDAEQRALELEQALAAERAKADERRRLDAMAEQRRQAIARRRAADEACLRADEEAEKLEAAGTEMDAEVMRHAGLLDRAEPGAELAERQSLESGRETIAQLDEQERQEMHAEFTRLQAELATDRTASELDKRIVSEWCDYTDPSKQVKLDPDKVVGRAEFSHLLRVGFERVVLEMLTLSQGLLERRRDKWSKAGSFLSFIMGRLPVLSTVAFFGEIAGTKYRDRKAAKFATKISSAWHHDLDTAVTWKNEVVALLTSTYGELTPLQQQRLTVKQVQPVVDRLLAWSLEIMYQRSDEHFFASGTLVSGLLRKRSLQRTERDRVLYKVAGVKVRLTDLLINSGLCEHEPSRKAYYTETRGGKDTSPRCGFRHTEEVGLHAALGYALQRTEEGVKQRVQDTGMPIDLMKALRIAEAEKARAAAEITRLQVENAKLKAAASGARVKPDVPPRRPSRTKPEVPPRRPSRVKPEVPPRHSSRATPKVLARTSRTSKIEPGLLESVKALVAGGHGFLVQKTTDTQLTLSDVSFRARKAEASVYAGAIQGLTDALSVYPDVEVKRQGTSVLEITGEKKSMSSIMGFFRNLTMQSEAKSDMGPREIKCAVM